MRRGLGLTALVWIGWAAGCKAPTASQPPSPVDVRGQWAYAATQTSPAQASLSGTLAITTQSGPSFGGTLDVVETDAQGQARHLSGIVSGRLLDSASVDFDAFLDVSGRRHLGAVLGDSLHGTWVEQDAGGATNSGAFAGRRTSR